MLDSILNHRFLTALSSGGRDATERGTAVHVSFLFFQHHQPFHTRWNESLFKREFGKALCCKRGTVVDAASTGEAITNVEANSRIVSLNVLQRQIQQRNSQETGDSTPEVYYLSLALQDQHQALGAITTVVERNQTLA